MALIKQIITECGFLAEYWKITKLEAKEYKSKKDDNDLYIREMSVVVKGYKDKESRLLGKKSLPDEKVYVFNMESDLPYVEGETYSSISFVCGAEDNKHTQIQFGGKYDVNQIPVTLSNLFKELFSQAYSGIKGTIEEFEDSIDG